MDFVTQLGNIGNSVPAVISVYVFYLLIFKVCEYICKSDILFLINWPC